MYESTKVKCLIQGSKGAAFHWEGHGKVEGAMGERGQGRPEHFSLKL